MNRILDPAIKPASPALAAVPPGRHDWAIPLPGRVRCAEARIRDGEVASDPSRRQSRQDADPCPYCREHAWKPLLREVLRGGAQPKNTPKQPRTTLSALVATTPSPKRSIGVAAGESFPTNLMRALAPMNDLASAVWSHASNPDVGMAVLLVSRGCWPVSPKPNVTVEKKEQRLLSNLQEEHSVTQKK